MENRPAVGEDIGFDNSGPVRDQKLYGEFSKKALEMGLDPDDRWVGGYVEYEWHHVRHLIDTVIGGKKSHILEFGCNFGATSVVTAILGHTVCAVDIDHDMVELAKLNAAQYGVSDKTCYNRIMPGGQLPYGDKMFDAVLCNSVLEYVSAKDMNSVLKEIDRVLKPGGRLLIFGTSNRLSPKEVHSGKWFTNYIPPAWDNFFFKGKHPERGLNPLKLIRNFRNYKNIDFDRRGSNYFKVKKLGGTSALNLMILRGIHLCVSPFGISVGLLTPSLSVNLEKPESTL
ncbi:hypothetical protein MNBD_ALPHA02-1520 [hydrothermal vent metagenome]|uniref:Methyltransferase type 11 domain-containing protein n=1 Tax=hydrothermal vent metagenome TaxID=652676 RepID=A0A3B0RT02_9ZZZZ